jgi:hypothetical protein
MGKVGMAEVIKQHRRTEDLRGRFRHVVTGDRGHAAMNRLEVGVSVPMLPEPHMPSPPTVAVPTSLSKSPRKFSITSTSNRAGVITRSCAAASE